MLRNGCSGMDLSKRLATGMSSFNLTMWLPFASQIDSLQVLPSEIAQNSGHLGCRVVAE
jgi:hypothetical protein